MTWLKWTKLRGKDGILGGDLVDTNTPFAGRDKMVHFVLGAGTWLFFHQWMNPVPALQVVLGFAVLNEVVEGVRYWRYGYTRILSDIPDGTDIIVTVAGGLAMLLIYALIHTIGHIL